MFDTFGVYKSGLPKMEEAELFAKFMAIIEADAVGFYQYMVNAGFDMWLQESVLPTKKPVGMAKLQSVVLNKRVRHVIEKEYCGGGKIVSSLDPERIRFLSMLPNRMPVQTFDLEAEEKAEREAAEAAKKE